MNKTSVTLWVDTDTNSLLSGFNTNSTINPPTFKQGDNFQVDVHFLKRGSNSSIELPTAGSSYKLAIGNPDALPTSGSWVLAYGSSQVEFDYNETALSVETSLNLIPEIIADGGVKVVLVNGDTTYRISFNNKVGISSAFTTDASNLIPSSYANVSQIKTGSANTRGVWHIKLKQVPVAYQSTWTHSLAPITIVTALDSNTVRVEIYPAPKDGTFFVTGTSSGSDGNNSTWRSMPMSVFSTEQMVIDAIRLPTTVIVNKSGLYSWDITILDWKYQSNGGGVVTVSAVVTDADDAGIIGYDFVSGEISLNNYETSSLLAGALFVDTTLEIEVTTGTTVSTVLQTPCRIVAEIIGQGIYSPSPFDNPISQLDVDAQLLNYVKKDGGTMHINAALDFFNGVSDSEVGAWGFGVESTGGMNIAEVTPDSIWVSNGSNKTEMTPLRLEVKLNGNDTDFAFVQSDNISVLSETKTAQVSTEGFAITDISNPSTPPSAWVQSTEIGITDGDTNNALMTATGVTIESLASTLSINSTGVTYPDGTTQTTATATVDLTDLVSKSTTTFQTLASGLATYDIIQAYQLLGSPAYQKATTTIAGNIINKQTYSGENPFNGNAPLVEGEYQTEFSSDYSNLLRVQRTIAREDGNHTNRFGFGLGNGEHYDGGGMEGFGISYIPPIGSSQKISIFPSGIKFSDNSFQTTAGYPRYGNPENYQTYYDVANGYYPLNSNPNGYLVSGDIVGLATLSSPVFTGDPQAPTPASTDNDTSIATTAFVKTAISNLVASAPSTLDTLNEIATALGNDPNLSTTLTNLIADKQSISGMASYLTAANASSTYQTIAGMSSYATQSYVTSQGYITSSALTPYLTTATASSTYQTQSGMSSYATQSYVTSQGYITSSALTPYLTSATASTTYYPISSNPSGYLTSISGITIDGGTY